jgi:hypothetical protein
MKKPKILLYPGAACPCGPGRYVRFVIPRGVPGCRPVVSCREVGPVEVVREHALPGAAVVAMHLPATEAR